LRARRRFARCAVATATLGRAPSGVAVAARGLAVAAGVRAATRVVARLHGSGAARLGALGRPRDRAVRASLGGRRRDLAPLGFATISRHAVLSESKRTSRKRCALPNSITASRLV